jgi:peptidoglycan/LPS O-acetylase OafA/YrhL
MFGWSGLASIDGALVEGQMYDPGEASIAFSLAATLGMLCLGALALIYGYCLAPVMPKSTRAWVTVGIGVLIAALLIFAFVHLLQGRPSSISV